MKIIKNREFWTNTTYAISFKNTKVKGAGWSFDCDSEGNLKSIQDLALENYNKCLSGENNAEYEGIKTYHSSGTSPAIGLCECGCKVYLSHFTNTCDKCEADYNMSGERLADRSQWGEETGEHWSDCY